MKGMTEDTAKRSIDWLHGTGCRVLAYMGGEPLLRPDLIHRITYYAAKKNFWIYLPTNARLLRTDVIDKLADAGISTFNIAVDAVDLKPGLPKALAADSQTVRLPDSQAVRVWLFRLSQHQYLPQ